MRFPLTTSAVGAKRRERIRKATRPSPLSVSLLLLLLIPMPLDGEEHAGAEHDDLEREEDDREPIPHVGDIQAFECINGRGGAVHENGCVQHPPC